MRLGLDSSAMAKRHIHEAGTARVLRRLREADEVVVSILVFPEIVSALNRRRREAALTDAQYDVHMRDLRDDIQGTQVIDLTPDVMGRAVGCLEAHPLRASDALHVATALEAGVDLFLSADRRQCRAARAMGLRVERVPATR